MSCQSPQQTALHAILPAESSKAGSVEASDSKPASRVKVYIGGSISHAAKKSCYSEINRQRSVPVEEVVDLYSSDYAILYEKINQGYYIRVEKQGRLIQTARALAEYELPMAAAALARDHIPQE